MKILYGTTNKAKLQAMRTALTSLDIEIIGLGDIEMLFILYWMKNIIIQVWICQLLRNHLFLTKEPHAKRVDGFPLDSLSIDIETGKYYYDLDVKDVRTSVDDGVRLFFVNVLT